jgi:hypothetical protein
MSSANSATCDTRRVPAPFATVAVRPIAGLTKQPRLGDYSPLGTCRPSARPRPAADWQVREEGEYYIPDLLTDEDYEPDPALSDAADAHTEAQREAMALLDDAENLLGVLLASIEYESDSRAMQADAVLKIVKKKLKKAHVRIDRQEGDHRNLFLAYFELNARLGKGAD